jgi:hypothetical protein
MLKLMRFVTPVMTWAVSRSAALMIAAAIVGLVLLPSWRSPQTKRPSAAKPECRDTFSLCTQGAADNQRPGWASAEIAKPDGEIPPPPPFFIGCGGVGVPRHIAFVCDASASMGDRFEWLKEQLSRAISKLRPHQTFVIVFFQDGKAISFSRDFAHQDGVVVPTPENRMLALAFVERIRPDGRSDPSEALRVVFLRKPHLLYLLSVGDFADRRAARDAVSGLNMPKPDGTKTRVNAIAFVDDPNEEAERLANLQKIADEQNGAYIEIKEEDLDD